ncbi:hypothetical protein [Paenibacillus sp. WLX2291]|uniref:hypothetical protein n=1 Tax=Paenibacillus sp. WLX2291 TaxID=3296934 RepID=UPI003983FC1F
MTEHNDKHLTDSNKDDAFEQGKGAGVDPIPDPDPNHKNSASDLLEQAVDDSLEKLEDDFTGDDDKPQKHKS